MYIVSFPLSLLISPVGSNLHVSTDPPLCFSPDQFVILVLSAEHVLYVFFFKKIFLSDPAFELCLYWGPTSIHIMTLICNVSVQIQICLKKVPDKKCVL